MWNDRLEAHAARMRARFAAAREKEARLEKARLEKALAKEERKRERRRRQELRSVGWCPQVNAMQIAPLPEQVDILARCGVHTSVAAKELGWSVKRVQTVSVALGILDAAVLTARRGRSGRPARPPKPSPLPAEKHPITPEIDEILRTSGGSIARAAANTKYPRAIVRKRMIQLGLIQLQSGGKVLTKRYLETPEIDSLMRRFPGRLAKVARLTGWSTDAVARRMKELGLSDQRADESTILDLLREYEGSVVAVYRALRDTGARRSESYIARIRQKHGIQRTRQRTQAPQRRGATPGFDQFIDSLLRMSPRARAEYIRLLSKALPDTISAQRLSCIVGVSRRTLKNYLNQGWLPNTKSELLEFFVSQCDFRSVDRPSGGLRQGPDINDCAISSRHHFLQQGRFEILQNVEVLRNRIAALTQDRDLREELEQHATVRILSGEGTCGDVDLKKKESVLLYYRRWGQQGSDSKAMRLLNGQSMT